MWCFEFGTIEFFTKNDKQTCTNRLYIQDDFLDFVLKLIQLKDLLQLNFNISNIFFYGNQQC
jgi:hypothetical protein